MQNMKERTVQRQNNVLKVLIYYSLFHDQIYYSHGKKLNNLMPYSDSCVETSTHIFPYCVIENARKLQRFGCGKVFTYYRLICF